MYRELERMPEKQQNPASVMVNAVVQKAKEKEWPIWKAMKEVEKEEAWLVKLVAPYEVTKSQNMQRVFSAATRLAK